MSTLTIRIDEKLEVDLDRIARLRHQSKSEVARQMLRAQLLRETLRKLHEEMEPQARAKGWLSEDDILSEIS